MQHIFKILKFYVKNCNGELLPGFLLTEDKDNVIRLFTVEVFHSNNFLKSILSI